MAVVLLAFVVAGFQLATERPTYSQTVDTPRTIAKGPTPIDWLSAGKQHYREGKLDEAIALFTEVVYEDSAVIDLRAEALLLIADIESFRTNDERAREYWKWVIRYFPGSRFARVAQERLRTTAQEPEQADTNPKHAAPDETLRRTFEAYKLLPGQKAFAVALENGKITAWGFSHSATDVAEAAQEASEECTSHRDELGLLSDCQVIYVADSAITEIEIGGAGTSRSANNALPAAATGRASSVSAVAAEPTQAVEPRGITYSEQWVEGQSFKIGASPEAQVWVSFSSKDQPHAMVYLVNAGQNPITFRPKSTRIWTFKSGGERRAMITFSASEYEKKVERRHRIRAGLAALGTALANQPKPRTTTVQGTSTGSAWGTGPGGQVYVTGYGTFTGTITQWPTAQDYAAAGARSAAQVGAMRERLSASFAQMASNLARTHTLSPGSYYGGIVYFEKERGTRYEIRVPFGNETFEFEFTR